MLSPLHIVIGPAGVSDIFNAGETVNIVVTVLSQPFAAVKTSV